MKLQKKVNFIIIIILMIIELLIGEYRNQYRRIENDEIFSVGLANNTGDYLFFENREIENFSNYSGWMLGKCFNDYITVQPNEKLSVKNVFINQGRDNHPPLFYLLVNCISSITPNHINYLWLTFINMWSMCGVIWLLYLSMKKIVGDKWYSVVPSVIWLCSTGCYQLTNYIRMYTLLCFWTCLMTYLHICLIMEGKVERKRQIQLALVVCLGGLTHYYFYVFGFFLAGAYLIILLLQIKNELKQKYLLIWEYVLPYLLGGGLALATFPKVLRHVFKSSMSGRMQENLKGNSLPFRETYDVIVQNVFWGKMVGSIVVIGGALVLFLFFLYHYKSKKIDDKYSNMQNGYLKILTILLATLFGYLCISMKASVYVAWYYISPSFSLIILIFSLAVMMGEMDRYNKMSTIICLLLCGYSIYFLGFIEIPLIIQERKEDIVYCAMVEELSNSDCIYLSESWNCLYGNHLPDMAKMDEVRCITPEEFVETDLQELLDGRETTEQGLIMICRKVDDQDTYLEQMIEQTGLQGELVWSDEKNAFYRFQ